MLFLRGSFLSWLQLREVFFLSQQGMIKLPCSEYITRMFLCKAFLAPNITRVQKTGKTGWDLSPEPHAFLYRQGTLVCVCVQEVNASLSTETYRANKTQTHTHTHAGHMEGRCRGPFFHRGRSVLARCFLAVPTLTPLCVSHESSRILCHSMTST